MAPIFYLSAQQSVGPELPAFTRVIAHFTEYALLGALWIWALVPALGRRALIAAAAICVLYAASDEYHQSFVEGRDSDLVDFLIDALRDRLRGAAGQSRCQLGEQLRVGVRHPA